MCGIAGVLDIAGRPIADSTIRRMTAALAHRGPDGEGIFVEGPIALGHRRLAIIDLSAAGHEPMGGDRGQVLLTYNGEIYNFEALRAELEPAGHRFRSATDAEVIVHAYEEWGAECVSRFNGMFAFAIWDRARRRLFLARDRYGIKPLYWTSVGSEFIFGSEIKAILAHPSVQVRVSAPALNEYFTFQNMLSELTLFDGIRLLPAASTLTVDIDASIDPKPHRYWDYRFAPEESLSEADAASQLESAFRRAVRRQLVSDVPVGAYLSGGIDSGSIATIAARSLPRLRTFTGGFDLSSASGIELGFDERASAESMAHLIQSEHYEVVLHAGDMAWVMPELVWHLEDLRVGQSYPNYYIARLASHFVKVALSGAGGDELFGGYPWRYYRGMGEAGKGAYLRRYYDFWQRLVPDEDKALLLKPSVRAEAAGHEPFDAFEQTFNGYDGSFDTPGEQLNASLYFELRSFLPGLLLVEDKLSMAHGLETRVPFLDDEVVDLAMRLPARMKLRNLDLSHRVDENTPGKRFVFEQETSDGKPILREAMRRILPADVVGRRKQGFSAPDASWFRGESIDYVTRLLRPNGARIYEFLEPAYVARVLDEHTSGRINRRLLIWSFLSFEWWLRTFLDGQVASERPEASALVASADQ
jgi:asparagine synthase (glutamine-hydrolysing)